MSWLLSAASDVCFYRSYGYTAYEFSISQDVFLKWAHEKGFDLHNAVGEIRIYRWQADGLHLSGHERNTEDNRDGQEKYGDALWKVIASGFEYKEQSGNGAAIQVVYDRVSGRAYFQATPR